MLHSAIWKPREKAKITVEYMQLLEFHGKKSASLSRWYWMSAMPPAKNPIHHLSPELKRIFCGLRLSGELLVKKPSMRGLSTLLLMLSDVPTPKGLKVSAVGKADRDFVVDLEVENSGVLCLAQDGKEWAAFGIFYSADCS